MSVHDESVPGGAQHPTQLGDGKGIDVLAHCRNTQAKMRRLGDDDRDKSARIYIIDHKDSEKSTA